jgi:hypothetical protein
VASSSLCPYWIVTVKFSEDTGVPPVAVPVNTALVLPVDPVVVVVLLLELLVVVLLPPPHAAIAVTSDNASSIPAILQPSCLRCGLIRRVAAKITRPSEIAPPVSHPPVSHLTVPQGRRNGLTVLAVVVFTVTVTGIPVVADVEDVNTTVLGLNVQVAAVGRFEHAKVTVPVYPFTG